MAQRLYELLKNLMGDGGFGTAIRKRFDVDPEKVTENLDAKARRALYTMDRDLISAYVGTEILDDFSDDADTIYAEWATGFHGWPFPEGEFPGDTLPPECQKQGSGMAPLYPNPEPEVYGITPSSASVADGKVDIDVAGQGFVKDKSTVELVQKTTGQLLTVGSAKSSGTYRCGHLKASVMMPTAPGEYAVRVVIEAGASGGQTITLRVPSKVTFTVNP